MSDEYEVLYNVLPELAAEIQRVAGQLVRKAAFDIQAKAQQNAPVDTGYLKSSIYVVTKTASTYGKGVTDPPPGAALLDAVPAPTVGTEALVAVGANYGVYVEMGSAHAPAQPYLVPAADAVAPGFKAAMAKLEDHLLNPEPDE